MRRWLPPGWVLAWILLSAACSRPADPAPARAAAAPTDAAHQGITDPHGDHSPHHGGMVLMNGDMHFEVVFDRGGRHEVWFTDAIRTDLPASVASSVTMSVARPGQPPEELTLAIDDSGESWVADGRAVDGENVVVTVTYVARGEPYEIELPFQTPSTK
jgi:hypothetical protein